MLETLYNNILIPWVILGLLTATVLFKIKAPYGKFSNNLWGPTMSFKWGWIIQEIISLISFSFFFLTGDIYNKSVIWVFFIIWNMHYINRSIFFPLRQNPTL